MPKYTNEKNTLMLISLLKAHNIKKIIASPGTTNVAFVEGVQLDPWFEVYSAADERSAGYIACGLAEESSEPVVLSCTQATASRNYLPALTEAYYRKLPILAVTSTQHLGRIGQNIQQAIDRTQQPADAVELSVHIPVIHTEEDEWACNVSINTALLALRRDGNGPVHMNLTTSYSREFDVEKLPRERVIKRITHDEIFPDIPQTSKVAIFVGAHSKWTTNLTTQVDEFCRQYGAVVLCDPIANYKGKYAVNPSLLLSQKNYSDSVSHVDILIHLGNVTGAPVQIDASEVWRVNPDGEVRDTFHTLSYVFEMSETHFFESINNLKTGHVAIPTLESWRKATHSLTESFPELPFSNAWLAHETISKLPEDSILHLGIYNSLRNWSFYNVPDGVFAYSNTGGFGIDGGVSSLVGASLSNDKLHFGVFGDLAFFYDMNVLGNRHVGSNVRILLINNGIGTEFKNPDNRAYKLDGLANGYIAAQGHYGNKSHLLVKHYAEDLGFQYISASSKEEYLKNVDYFTNPDHLNKSLIFEVFTDTVLETEALDILYHLKVSKKLYAKEKVKSIIGSSNIQKIKKVLHQ